MQKGTIEWQKEEQYLQETKNAISTKINLIDQALNERKSIVEEMKEQYTHQTRDLDTYEKQAVFKRIDDFMIFANEQIDYSNKLKTLFNRPYFARIDFSDKNNKLNLYFGLQSIDDGDKYYVIDWRAPVGELFYEYGLGKASYNTPDGKVNGEVTLKRQYDIQDGQLIDVFDVDLNIFDEYLQKVLAKVNTDKLHNVVSTIQKEQNEIIRNLKSDLIVVQGFVGSGKTTVALHRIAYMLYRLPNLNSSNILIFSLNEVFLKHISGVLPELGEQNTRSATLPKFIRRLLKLSVPIESMDEYSTRFEMMPESEKQISLSKIDYSMKEKVKSFVNNYINDIHFTHGFKLKDKTFSRVMLNDLLNKSDSPYIIDKVEFVKSYVCKDCNITNPEIVNIIDEEVNKRLSNSIDMYDIYNEFLKANGYQPCMFNEKIKYEDAILLCLVRECYNDLIVKMDIKQVFIDEAQEYPLVFIEFLMRLWPHAQFSIFGDDYQCTTAGAVSSIRDMLQLNVLQGEKTYYQLDKTYRSSEEIVEYADKIINANQHNAFRLKSGNSVDEIIMANDVNQVSQQVFDILEQVVPNKGSIGIITGDKQYAEGIYNELCKVIPHRVGLVNSSRVSVDNQIQILPVGLAKGLEFDTAIVVLNGGLFEGTYSNNHKYIACTRAINKLYVFKKN